MFTGSKGALAIACQYLDSNQFLIQKTNSSPVPARS